MITGKQYRRLMKLSQSEESLGWEAAKAGMDEKTARKWRRKGEAPGAGLKARGYRTRKDAFEGVWGEIEEMLKVDGNLEAKTIFDWLGRRKGEEFQEGQLRTLQRRVKAWGGRGGPGREVYFPQKHVPGRQGQSDFTHMGALGITIAGQAFNHLFYHFTLTYSNWEWGGICFSESYESLAGGVEK